MHTRVCAGTHAGPKCSQQMHTCVRSRCAAADVPGWVRDAMEVAGIALEYDA